MRAQEQAGAAAASLGLVIRSLQILQFGGSKTFHDVPVSFEEKCLHILHPGYKYRIQIRKASEVRTSSSSTAAAAPDSLTVEFDGREFVFRHDLGTADPREQRQFAELVRRVQSCFDKSRDAGHRQFEQFLETSSAPGGGAAARGRGGRQLLHRGKQLPARRGVFGSKKLPLSTYGGVATSPPPSAARKPRFEERFSDDETEGQEEHLKSDRATIQQSTGAPEAAASDEELSSEPDLEADDAPQRPKIGKDGPRSTRRSDVRIGKRLTKPRKTAVMDGDDESSDDDMFRRSPTLTTPAPQRVVISPTTSRPAAEQDRDPQDEPIDASQRPITNFFRPKSAKTQSSQLKRPESLSSPLPTSAATTPSRLPPSAARLVKSAKSTIQQNSWLHTSPARFDPSAERRQGLFGSPRPTNLQLLNERDRYENDRHDPIPASSTPPRIDLFSPRVLKRPKLQPLDAFRTYPPPPKHRSPFTPSFGDDAAPASDAIVRPKSRFRGIQNLGNTCYCASSLQMLCSAFDFVKALDGRGGRLARSVVHMAEELQLDSPFASPVDPREVKDAMDARTDRFAGYEQRDAHEFMGELVDAIHEELQLDQMQSETNLSQVRLPTDDFRMTVHKILKCESCGYDRTMNEMYRYLSIDIVNDDTMEGASLPTGQRSKPSVEKGLSHYFEPDVREVKCEKCSVGTHATETLFVAERPRFLLLHLKRFMWVERRQPAATIEASENLPPNGPAPPVEYVFQKNKAAVSIPESLILDPFCKEDDVLLRSGSRYKLKSIVHHIGQRPSSGHYIAHAIRRRRDNGEENHPQPDPNAGEKIPAAQEDTSVTQVPSSVPEKASRPSGPDPSTESNAPPPPLDPYQWVVFDDNLTAITDLDHILNSPIRQSTAYMLLYALEDELQV